MDKNIIKKFKLIIADQMTLQDSLMAINAKMIEAITVRDVVKVHTLVQEIDHICEQVDCLERNRKDLLLPYCANPAMLSRIRSFIKCFPKEEHEGIMKTHVQLQEKVLKNLERSKVNENLLRESLLDFRKDMEIITSAINRPIHYGMNGMQQKPLPRYIVNERI